MPIYEFVCQGCAQKFEELIRRDADLQALACPRCRGKRYRRVMSGFALGSGQTGPDLGHRGRRGSSCAGCHSHSCGTCKH
jgi:putative FmdB family regulatory protein